MTYTDKFGEGKSTQVGPALTERGLAYQQRRALFFIVREIRTMALAILRDLLSSPNLIPCRALYSGLQGVAQ